MIYLIPIVLFFIPLLIKLRKDFWKWVEDTPVNHDKDWKWVALSELTTSGVFFFVLCPQPPFLAMVATIGLITSWYWFLFDGLYNIVRKRYAKKEGWKLINGQYDFWYTGSEDEDDSRSDNFLQTLELWEHIAIKIGLIILFTFLYFYA